MDYSDTPVPPGTAIFLLQGKETLLKEFKRDSYEQAFYSYLREARPFLTTLTENCENEPEKAEEYQKEVAEEITSFVEEEVSSLYKISRKEAKQKLEQYKTILALYTVPMILEQDISISNDLADAIVTNWSDTYPGYSFKKGSYEELLSGFSMQSRLGCFITEAVCRGMDKPDDCYELTAFRHFRDEYLLHEPDGEKLIQAYYEVAPRIVEIIDEQDNCEELYSVIWEDYLATCLEYIEEGNYKACKELYIEMVQNLQEEYL